MSRTLDTPTPSLSRNINIYDDDGHILGGLYQNGSLTNSNLYKMCTIFIIATEQFAIFRLNEDGSTGSRVFQNKDSLLAASYIILTNDGKPNSVRITNECAIRRIITKIPSSKLTETNKCFRDRVRDRDGQCVMTGLKSYPGDFTLLHATHIVPYAREQAWVDEGFSRWITDVASPQSQGATKIHSVQNELLLSLCAQALFDTHAVAVDVNDGYKITFFAQDVIDIDGRTLHPCCRDPQNPDRVPDQLLQWHYRQAVLASVKGEGQRRWDMDIYDMGDVIGEILEGPDSAERMEVEMYTRLGPGEIHHSASPEVESP